MKKMKIKLANQIIPIAITILLSSCASGKIVLSNRIDIHKYKYVVFGTESSGDSELYDIIMEVKNYIATTNLTALSASDISKIAACSDSILSPNIHVTSEKWDGGHTYITVTFYDYVSKQSIAVVKNSGIGMTINHDQNIALRALRKKLDLLFKKY